VPRHDKATAAQFADALRRAPPAPVYILTGPRYFQERALAALRAVLFPAGAAGGGQAEDGALWSPGDGGFDAQDFCDQARETPLFTPHRLLFALGLKDRDARALAERAEAVLERPNARATLALGFVEARALTAKVFSAAAISRWDFAAVYPDRLPAFAGELARECGLALPPAVLRAVVDASAGELALIAGEINKLALASESGKLGEAEALALIALPEAGEYELSGRIEAAERDAALRVLAAEQDAGENAQPLLSTLSGALGGLLLAKSAPAADLAVLMRKPPFIAQRIAAAARPLSARRLRAAQRRLAGLELASRRQATTEAEFVAILRDALTPGRD